MVTVIVTVLFAAAEIAKVTHAPLLKSDRFAVWVPTVIVSLRPRLSKSTAYSARLPLYAELNLSATLNPLEL